MSTTESQLATERAIVELHNLDEGLSLMVGAVRSRLTAALGALARARDGQADRLYSTSEDPNGAPFDLGSFVESNAESPDLVTWVRALRALAPGESCGLDLVTITRLS